jgi:hypothetical protein
MTAKIAITDASSAIILCRAGLHAFLAGTYDIVFSESVYREITVGSYTGSLEYRQMVNRGEIRVHSDPVLRRKPGMAGLDGGESAAILLFYAGQGDFIITDDGPAARYCRKEDIPFINALLFPVVLHLAGMEDEAFTRSAMARIIESGRYSRQVIALARECRQENISFALP